MAAQLEWLRVALALVIALAILQSFVILFLVVALRKVDEIARAVRGTSTTPAPRSLEQRFRAAIDRVLPEPAE
jgi:hypothetical protein